MLIYSYPFIDLLSFDIKNIIGEYMYGNINYGEVMNDIDNLQYNKSEIVNKIFNINKKIYNYPSNRDDDRLNELFYKYYDLILKIYNPLFNGLSLMDHRFEFLFIMNYPFEICDEEVFIENYIL